MREDNEHLLKHIFPVMNLTAIKHEKTYWYIDL